MLNYQRVFILFGLRFRVPKCNVWILLGCSTEPLIFLLRQSGGVTLQVPKAVQIFPRTKTWMNNSKITPFIDVRS